MSHLRKATSSMLLCVTLVFSASAIATPPPHAPAHGWRQKHDPYYVGYSGRQWEKDYGILSGRCNREAIGTVLGAAVGAVVLNRTATPENRTVATVVGAMAGAVIGNRIGRKLDESDRGCLGHALELGDPGRRIEWANESTGVRYEVAPGDERDRNGKACREFTLVEMAGSGGKLAQRGLACQSQPGVWEVAR